MFFVTWRILFRFFIVFGFFIFFILALLDEITQLRAEDLREVLPALGKPLGELADALECSLVL